MYMEKVLKHIDKLLSDNRLNEAVKYVESCIFNTTSNQMDLQTAFTFNCYKCNEELFSKADRVLAYLKEYKTEFLCDKEATFAFAKGLINYYTGQYDDAYDDFYDAMESDPNNDIYSFYLGCASYKLEDFTEAMSFFNRAIRKSSKGNAYYYFWRALARYRTSNYSQAVNEFKKAVKLDPNNEIYTSWLNSAVYDENTYDHPRNYLG